MKKNLTMCIKFFKITNFINIFFMVNEQFIINVGEPINPYEYLLGLPISTPGMIYIITLYFMGSFFNLPFNQVTNDIIYTTVISFVAVSASIKAAEAVGIIEKKNSNSDADESSFEDIEF